MPELNLYLSKKEMYEILRSVAEESGEKICLIFGAGASYDYTNNPNYHKPPIVADLFDDTNPLVNKIIHKTEHKYILRLKNHLKDALVAYDNDLEKYLSSLYDKNSDDDDLFQQMLFYLHDIFSLSSKNIDEDDNNYMRMIQQLATLRGKLPWTCISFNYDTILEQSYVATGRNTSRVFDSLRGYVEYDAPKILKIHGSTNFRYHFKETEKKGIQRTEKEIFNQMMSCRNMSGEEESLVIIDEAEGQPDFHYLKQEWKNEGGYESFHNYHMPLIMIPIHGMKKTENLYFEDMVKQAKKEIEDAKLIIAIGYNFGDDSFANSIKEIDTSKKYLVLVGGKSLLSNPEDHQSYINAKKIWRSGNIRVFKDSGFSNFIPAIQSAHSL